MSMQIAQIAKDPQRRPVIVDDPLFVDDHLDAIIVHRDDRLLDALQGQLYSPSSTAATARASDGLKPCWPGCDTWENAAL